MDMQQVLEEIQGMQSRIAEKRLKDEQELAALLTKLGARSDEIAEEIKRTLPPIMPLFRNGLTGTVGEKEDEASSEESASDTEGEEASKKKQVNAVKMMGNIFERLPYPVIIDSGAAESVFPKSWCPFVATRKGEDYGREYSAANGTPIVNQGQKTISMVTRDGKWIHSRFQLCNVTRPLASASRIVQKDHSVVFNPE